MSITKGKICLPPGQKVSEEVRLQDTCKIPANEKVIILRALKNANPESEHMRQCIENTTKNIMLGKGCPKKTESLTVCDCSEDSTEIDLFCRCFKSRRCYNEEELQYFVDVVECKFIEELEKIGIEQKHQVCRPQAAEFCLVPVIIRCCGKDLENSTESSTPCDCVAEVLSLTCYQSKALKGICKPRAKPVKFRHFGDLLEIDSEVFERAQKPFSVDYVGESEEIGKWGRFLDIIERVLRRKEIILKKLRFYHEADDEIFTESSDLNSAEIAQVDDDSQSCFGDVCPMPKRRDHFEKLDRFKDIQVFGYATFCINSMRWTNCATKRWKCLVSQPHLVIHLPSMSFPCNLRSTARKQFESLQNIQIGRIGWLVNEHAQVLYIYPGKSNYATKCILKNFVRLARPDISLSRLWIIENDDECLCDEVDEEVRSGCESLFFTPNVYRRVRHLSAGCHSFIIPGVMCKTDIFIACELKTSILGPCLEFQQHLLNKHYVMSVLAKANIPHPPFVGVRSFSDLCEKMSALMLGLPKCWERKWLLKINCGFCANQTALIYLEKCFCCKPKEDLSRYLAYVLPRKLRVNKKAYKDTKDFFVELERHGGVLTACPPGDYQTVSLGCFIEHDTAKARLRTAADVLRTRACEDCNWNDIGYIIPQTTLPETKIQELVIELGEALLMEQHIGFFGIDVVVFREDDDDPELNYWVADIDPYYTDLLSFDDWRRFCLDIPSSASFSTSESLLLDCKDKPRKISSEGSAHRFVVCSGKLYLDGLSRCSGDFLVDLCKKQGIAYSHKARTGCMICPIDTENRALLMFSFCRSREIALRNFVRALKALHCLSREESMPVNRPVSTYILNLARDMEATYSIPSL